MALTLGSVALSTSCASPQLPKDTPVRGSATAVPALPPEGAPPRRLPRSIGKSREDFYPTEAKRHSLTGPVLLEFQIDPRGEPKDARVLAAKADPTLQAAALAVLKDQRFDTADPAYDAADSIPYRVTILFCMFSCGSLTPYAGYEQAHITVVGYISGPGMRTAPGGVSN